MQLPLGAGTVDISLPDCSVTVAEPAIIPAIDVAEHIELALDNPVGQGLNEIVDAASDVCIVITDMTRDAPEEELLSALLEELHGLGIDRSQITVVVGLGLHRPMTDEEIVEMVGPAADLVQNHDPASCETIGTIDGCPIDINQHVVDADVVLSTGVVEPHQYAGFSGGAKTVVIGAGGESQITYTHGPAMLAKEGVRLGRIEQNPFREFIDNAGDLVGIDFCLNVAYGPRGVLGIAAGEPRKVVSRLAAIARDALAVPVKTGYDAVVG